MTTINLKALMIFSNNKLAWKLLVLRVILKVVTIILEVSLDIFLEISRRPINI
jgi:hypothetical protein